MLRVFETSVRVIHFKIEYFFFAVSLATVGCTTTMQVPIASSPAEAEIVIDGKLVGTTPKLVTLEACYSHELSLHLEGYYRERIDLIAVGSGFQCRLSPGAIDIELDAKTERTAEPPPPLSVDKVMQQLDELLRLLNSGLISEEEYEQARIQIILSAIVSE